MPAFFRSTVSDFLGTVTSEGLDRLTAGLTAEGFSLTPDQRAAWVEEWPRLVTALRQVVKNESQAGDWALLLEYTIPGRQKRIDALLLTPHGIVVIEFKSGDEATSAARWQAREYCWNLRDFHRQSAGVSISPILCAAEILDVKTADRLDFSDRHGVVLDLQICNPPGLAAAILRSLEILKTRPAWKFDAEAWDTSVFQPTQSVIQFAQRLFGGHDVREITHAHSDNTDIALNCIHRAVLEARQNSKRIICFVTGVPGAGKTLVGLNAAYRPEMFDAANGPICFASGNLPLLAVLKKALVQNRSSKSRKNREIRHDITAPVQDVHSYVRESLSAEPIPTPAFNCIVFDEAQRVWNAEKLLDGLKTRQRRGHLSQQHIDRILAVGKSEPELLLSLMEKCPKWCVVIALVGGGQEIHDGEAGLGEWGKALYPRTLSWEVWASKRAIIGSVASANQRLFEKSNNDLILNETEELDLAVSKRSLRAERFADWVNNVVNGNANDAKKLSHELSEYPVLVTRDLHHAKSATLSLADDQQLRCGLLASSGAIRLRADGVEVSPEFRGGIDFPDWFLRPTGDIRSSSQLEVAATEFECQGLELDWCCVCWEGDFVFVPEHGNWQCRKLRSPGGNKPRWYAEDEETREFVRNKYRVLLTRARIGVVIYVPKGSLSDLTRSSKFFDATADFLIRCGAVSTL